MNDFEWVEATTVADALGALHARAQIKAGGVDLMDLMKEGIVRPERLVNVRRIKGLDRIAADEARLRIGATVPLARLGAPEIAGPWTALAEAATHAATPQIRAMATVAGNLLQRPRCWYFRSEAFLCKKKGGETCFAQDGASPASPERGLHLGGGDNRYHAIFDNHTCAIVHPSSLALPLVAFGASAEIAGPGGTREAPLESFFVLPESPPHRENALAPGEVMTEVRVPRVAGATSAYARLGEKESHDWPLAECAVVLVASGGVVKSASVVLGAAAPAPRRAKEAEAALVGKPLNEATARDAARAALAGATPLAHNGYKVQLLETVVHRTILKAGGVA